MCKKNPNNCTEACVVTRGNKHHTCDYVKLKPTKANANSERLNTPISIIESRGMPAFLLEVTH